MWFKKYERPNIKFRGILYAHQSVRGLSKLIPLRYIKDGEIMPHGWGVTWNWMEARATVISPLPFNWIFHWWYEACWYLKIGPARRAK